MSSYIHLYASCNNNGEISAGGDNRNHRCPAAAAVFSASFGGEVDTDGGISEKCIIGIIDDSHIRSSGAESPQLKSGNEGEVENLSSSEAELSDTESTHQAMSLSSPEDGPHLGSEEDYDAPDQKKTLPFKGVVAAASQYYAEQCSRPRVGSSPESTVGKEDDPERAEAEAEKGDKEKLGGDAEKEVKVEKDVLEQEEDNSQYVMSCNLRGPSRHNVKKAERLILGLMSTPKLARTPEESDEQYTKRVRKHNYLSLAQEFVARNKSQAAAAAVAGEANADKKLLDCRPEDTREWAKNVKNMAKCPEVPRGKLRRPVNLESLSLNESSLFLPVHSVLGSSSTNQNAIHRYHQRSLAQLELRPAKKGLAATSPTHAGPRCKNAQPANKARMSCYADLPANVARMAQEGGAAKTNYERSSWRQQRASGENPSPHGPANAGKRNRASAAATAADGQMLSRSDCDLPSYHQRSGSKAPSPPHEILGGFDVYNIETAMPTIDWIAMEEHLAKAAKEEMFLHKHHRNNREEIRRKLAMGSDTDDYYGGERMNRKPSLQARLQSGMNLQICFMNETASDPESVHADLESMKARSECGIVTPATEKNVECASSPPLSGSVSTPANLSSSTSSPQLFPLEESKDFLTKQARLQAEARLALAQAKQMAHMQMEVEKQRKKKSPIAEMVGIPFPDGRHKVSRHALLEMNVAQLQVIVNDLHTQIENLNEELVHLLMERDDLHMEQDSMLVDIEDLTRYL